MSVTYIPNYKNYKDNIILNILLDDKEVKKQKLIENEYITIKLNKNTIYSDLDKYSKLLNNLQDTSNGKEIIIIISNNSISNTLYLEHILSKCVKNIIVNPYKSTINIIITHNTNKKLKHIENIVSIITKVEEARKISMIPSNMSQPIILAKQLKSYFKKYKTKIFDTKYLEKHNFNLIRSVGESSSNKPCILVIERIINKNNPTICIVGKGITFDSGGLAIKDLRSMVEMKFDKIGAISSCFSLLHLLELKSLENINLVGILPFAENIISSSSVHPGDVIKSYSGKTIEITDPDAEGRLILAEALSYSKKYKPSLIIDIATLTGHADSINFWHHGYYYAEPSKLKTLVEDLSNDIGERMIPMPSWSEYSNVLESSVADITNSPINKADSFTAALFLREFIPKNTDWIHIDVAHEFKDGVSQGNGIRSIIHIIEQYIKQKYF